MTHLDCLEWEFTMRDEKNSLTLTEDECNSVVVQINAQLNNITTKSTFTTRASKSMTTTRATTITTVAAISTTTKTTTATTKSRTVYGTALIPLAPEVTQNVTGSDSCSCQNEIKNLKTRLNSLENQFQELKRTLLK